MNFLTEHIEGQNDLAIDCSTPTYFYICRILAISVEVLMSRQFPVLAIWSIIPTYLEHICGRRTQLMLYEEHLAYLVFSVARRTLSRILGWSTVHLDFMAIAASFGITNYVKINIRGVLGHLSRTWRN